MNESDNSNMINRKFNAGDRIRHKGSGYVGTIVSGDDANGYSVHYPCDDEEYCVSKDEIEFVDAESVFLSRLQSLLREFDAVICEHSSWEPEGIDICIGNTELYYSSAIAASNIMDFEKQ